MSSYIFCLLLNVGIITVPISKAKCQSQILVFYFTLMYLYLFRKLESHMSCEGHMLGYHVVILINNKFFYRKPVCLCNRSTMHF